MQGAEDVEQLPAPLQGCLGGVVGEFGLRLLT